MIKTMVQTDSRVLEKALILIMETDRALKNGTKHYRISDGKPLLTREEILKALSDEGEIAFEPKKEDFGKMIRVVDHQVTQAKWLTPQPLPVIGVCNSCGKKFSVHEFRDELSLTEFIISGLCQECQDKTFEEEK